MIKYVNENGICYVKHDPIGHSSIRHPVYGPVAKCLQQQADEIERLQENLSIAECYISGEYWDSYMSKRKEVNDE